MIKCEKNLCNLLFLGLRDSLECDTNNCLFILIMIFDLSSGLSFPVHIDAQYNSDRIIDIPGISECDWMGSVGLCLYN